jgi:hypothetical protein
MTHYFSHLCCWLSALFSFITWSPAGATQKSYSSQLQNHTSETKYPVMKRAEQYMLNRLRHRVEQLEQAERHWPSTNRYHEMKCLQQQIDRLMHADPYQQPPTRMPRSDDDTITNESVVA